MRLIIAIIAAAAPYIPSQRWQTSTEKNPTNLSSFGSWLKRKLKISANVIGKREKHVILHRHTSSPYVLWCYFLQLVRAPMPVIASFLVLSHSRRHRAFFSLRNIYVLWNWFLNIFISLLARLAPHSSLHCERTHDTHRCVRWIRQVKEEKRENKDEKRYNLSDNTRRRTFISYLNFIVHMYHLIRARDDVPLPLFIFLTVRLCIML